MSVNFFHPTSISSTGRQKQNRRRI